MEEVSVAVFAGGCEAVSNAMDCQAPCGGRGGESQQLEQEWGVRLSRAAVGRAFTGPGGEQDRLRFWWVVGAEDSLFSYCRQENVGTSQFLEMRALPDRM